MSDANKAVVNYRTEATFRESSAEQALTALRITKSDLKHTKLTVESDEIKADGNVVDLVQVGFNGGGTLDFEWNNTDFDPFIKAIFQSTPTSGTVTATLASSGGNALTDGGVAITGATKTALKGARWVKIDGFTDSGNNGIKKLLSEVGGVYTFAASSFSSVESASVTLTWLYVRNNRVDPVQSFFLEEKMQLSSGVYSYLRHIGMVPSILDIDAKARAKIMGKLTFMGYGGTVGSASLGGTRATAVLTSTGTNASNGDPITIGTKVYTLQTSLTNVDGNVKIGASASATLDNIVAAVNLASGSGTTYAALMTANSSAPATAVKTSVTVVTWTATQAGTDPNAYASTETAVTLSFGAATFTGGAEQTAASSAPIVNSTSNVGDIQIDGAAFTSPCMSLNLQINNNERERPVIGDGGTLIPGSGKCQVNVKLENYFTTSTQLSTYVDHGSFALDFAIRDVNLKQRSFFMPKVRPKDGWPSIPGVNTDIMLPLDCQAVMDSTGTYTIQLDYVD